MRQVTIYDCAVQTAERQHVSLTDAHRSAHATALVEAQVCDRAEAERRAVRRYPATEADR